MSKYFNKILIANRGEIAMRVIRACQELGITSVALYSEPDKNAMHVREADEAYLIGEAAPSESYLNQDIILETARNSGCDAIHPGYGFLAENSGFAKRCAEDGFVFIGPSPEAIQLLGNKVESRIAMVKAGIPLITGTKEDAVLDDETIIKEADRIGFPVLVKAAAGGGGKGMRVVEKPQDMKTALESARRESQSAFGDSTLFLEKYLLKPRHIEFQIFGDQHGNHIHLFERECSIQRRHQKIIEEAPSVALNDDLRQRMGETAVDVAKAVNYTNAGTVEFLLDQDDNYYFLEVNTRIQVEHPVTEEVLGVDLVCEQIRVAAGEQLSLKQEQLTQRGHSLECRIYAEDAAGGFLPAAGPVLYLKEPGGLNVRFDGGVETGDEVSVYYDPIIAKLVVWGSDRNSAIQRMKMALDDTVILGLTTNKQFLQSVLDQPAFVSGDIHTGFLQEHMPDWQLPEVESDELNLALSVATLPTEKQFGAVQTDGATKLPEPWMVIGNWEHCGGGR